MKQIQVAIDGPAGAGKSTVAKRVANELGIAYIDTGAMYRAVAWLVLHHKIDPNQEDEITKITESTSFSLKPNEIQVNDRILTSEIRTSEVATLASKIAAMHGVRINLVRKQQEIASRQSVVMDGRDIGSHVLPRADYKFYLTASIEERAKRRYEEMIQKGETVELEQIKEEVKQRDYNDQNRDFAPLIQAEDAVLIDSTGMSIDQVVDKILTQCRTKLGGGE